MRENPATVYSDSLYSLSGFIDEFSTICFPLKEGNRKGKEGKLSKRDMEILLKWLTRDCGVVVTSREVRLYLIIRIQPQLDHHLHIHLIMTRRSYS
jgi:charged multivesicular body protein 7